MDAGKLDRRITLQRVSETDDGYGTVAGAWNDIATVWAQLMPMSGAERLAALQGQSHANARFRIRKSSDVEDLNAKDRIEYPSGIYYDIVSVREDERAYLVIDGVVNGG